MSAAFEALISTVKGNTENNLLKEIIRQLDDIGRKHYSGGASGYMAYGEPVHEKEQTGQVTLTQEELSQIRTTFGFHKDRDFRHEDLPSLIGHSGLLDLSQFPEKIVILDPITLPEVTKISITMIPGEVSYVKTLHPIFDKSLRRFIPKTDAMSKHIELVRQEFKPLYGGIYEHFLFTKSNKCIGVYIYPANIEEVPVHCLGGVEGALINKKGAREIYEKFSDRYAILDISSGDNHHDDDVDYENLPQVYLKVRQPLEEDEDESDYEDDE